MSIGWAAAAGAVASVAGAAITADSQGKQSKSARNAALGQEERARADQAPWRQQGQLALGVAGDLSGANGPDAATTAMADFQTSPGYQFRMDQGMRAVDAGAAARGMLRSGATLKAEQNFAQGLASNEFGAHYNRLLGLSTQGQAAASGQAQTAQNMAQTEASYGTQQAGITGQMGGAVQQGITNALTGYRQNQAGSVYGGTNQNALFGGNTDVNGTYYTYNTLANGGF